MPPLGARVVVLNKRDQREISELMWRRAYGWKAHTAMLGGTLAFLAMVAIGSEIFYELTKDDIERARRELIFEGAGWRN